MADIIIGDVTGTETIKVADSSLAGKSNLESLISGTTKFSSDLPQRMDLVNFQSATFGGVYQSPKIKIDQTRTLTVKAGANTVITRYTAHDSPLLGSDPTVPKIAIGPGDYWVSFEVDGTLDVAGAKNFPSGFGVTVDLASTVKLSGYTLFPSSPGPLPTLGDAIRAAISNTAILGSAADVRKQKPGTVYVSDISGTVTVGGSYSLPIGVNQLALAEALVPFKIAINPAITLKLGGSVALTGDYSVRMWRKTDTELVLGLFKKKGTTLSLTFSAGAGLGANAGTTDLVKMFFGAIDPTIDLATSGLPKSDPRYDAINKVLSDCINHALQMSVNASCAASFGDESAFVYSIDLTGDPAATDAAINAALGGDWSRLSTLSTAKELKNVVGGSRERKTSLAINLLGLFNYESVSDFVKDFTVLHNDEDGSVTLTDRATATRIAVASTPYLANPDRLRLVLYEAMIATAAYSAAGGKTTSSVEISQSLLIYHAKTNPGALRKELRLAVAIGELTPAQLDSIPIRNPKPAHVLIDASQKISGTQAVNMFFSDSIARTPRDLGSLKKLGRRILAGLLDPSDPVDERRIQVLNNDSIWAQMDSQQFPQDSPASYSDWYDVTFWSHAIHDTGTPLAAAIDALDHVPVGTDPSTDKNFTDKRDALRKALGEVTRDTHAAFEKPWPIAITYALAGGSTGAAMTARWDGTVQIPIPQQPATQPNALAKRIAARS
jgi:hypothetical protein